MGLISHANQVKPEHLQNKNVQEVKKKMGLLDRVINVSGYDQLVTSFTQLVNYTQAERACVLVSENNSSKLGTPLLYHGLDLTTVRRFLPNLQELNEKFPEGLSWYKVETKDGLAFFQSFFSIHEWTSLLYLYVKPVYCSGLETFYIFLFKSKLDIFNRNIEISETQTYLNKLQQILQQNLLLVSSLNFSGSFVFSEKVAKDHINSALDAKKHATLACFYLDNLFSDSDILNTDPVQLSLQRSLTFIIARLAGSSNLISMKDSGNIFAVFFSAQKVDPDLYFHQMIGPLEKTFGLHRVSKIKMEVLGTSTSVSEILRFLAGEK
ncbi:MAG TPA: hypothetical protein VJ861_01880 [Treponemataceae bacterium]|nr:hypothetical protein [Treponemataceae bacterium]